VGSSVTQVSNTVRLSERGLLQERNNNYNNINHVNSTSILLCPSNNLQLPDVIFHEKTNERTLHRAGILLSAM
jgi:hypothetical protein